jgi:S-adenosylmethionine hydrolase
MAVITLLTDFGLQDGYPGVMKGVIWKIAPNAQIADLSHDIAPQNILEAAILLSRSYRYFPDETIHVAIVDPGVGTLRRAIAAHIGTYYFVAPDNGLLTLIIEQAEASNLPIEFINLDRPGYWLPSVSNTFHGRDIFAPVAAYLAAGTNIKALGTLITDPIRLDIPKPQPSSNGWIGQVIYIDHFGNLSTNLHTDLVGDADHVIVKYKGEQIFGLSKSYAVAPSGTLVAVGDSTGSIAISKVNGNAAQTLSGQVADQVELILS